MDLCGCGGRCSFCRDAVSTSVLTASSTPTSKHPTPTTPLPIVPLPDFTRGSDDVVRPPPHAGVEHAEDKTIPTPSPPVPRAGVQRDSDPVVLPPPHAGEDHEVAPVASDNTINFQTLTKQVLLVSQEAPGPEGSYVHSLGDGGKSPAAPEPLSVDSSSTSISTAPHSTDRSPKKFRHNIATGGKGKKKKARLFSTLTPKNASSGNDGGKSGPSTTTSGPGEHGPGHQRSPERDPSPSNRVGGPSSAPSTVGAGIVLENLLVIGLETHHGPELILRALRGLGLCPDLDTQPPTWYHNKKHSTSVISCPYKPGEEKKSHRVRIDGDVLLRSIARIITDPEHEKCFPIRGQPVRSVPRFPPLQTTSPGKLSFSGRPDPVYRVPASLMAQIEMVKSGQISNSFPPSPELVRGGV